MVRACSAITFEVDDAEAALRELREQLTGFRLGAHTAGVLQCDVEYMRSGVAARVCAEIGFPVVGGTSVTQGVNGDVGDLCLSLLVLTGDDVEFAIGHTDGMMDGLNASVEAAYRAALGQSDLPPKLALIIPPVIDEFASDDFITAFERVRPDTPVFGSLYISEDIFTYEDCATICGTELFEKEISFLLVFGAVTPRFVVATLSEKQMLPMSGRVTKSEGGVVYEIDGRPAIQFFERNGMARGGVISENVVYMPFMFRAERPDGSLGATFARGIVRFGEDGSILCRGNVYPNSAVTVGTFNAPEIVSSTLAACDKINAMEDVNAAIIFSCIMRRYISGGTPLMETQKARERLRDDLPFIMASSGGEICPVSAEGGVENRFHNYSFIACLL